jgi:hypothetical protein
MFNFCLIFTMANKPSFILEVASIQKTILNFLNGDQFKSNWTASTLSN